MSIIKGLARSSVVATCFFCPPSYADFDITLPNANRFDASRFDATIGVANIYLFRGMDVGSGSAHINGDLSYQSEIGAYASLWLSSGGASNRIESSSEYDVLVGWRRYVGELEINIGMVGYFYPNEENNEVLDESELYIGLSFGPLALSMYDNVSSKTAGKEGYFYYAFSYVTEKYALTLGYAWDKSLPTINLVDGEYNYAHLDFSYAYSNILTFTLSQVVHRDAKLNGVTIDKSDYSTLRLQDNRYSALPEKNLLFVVSCSFPLTP